MNKRPEKLMFIMMLGLSFICTSCNHSEEMSTEQNKYLGSATQKAEKIETSVNRNAFPELTPPTTNVSVPEDQKFTIEDKKLSKINEDKLEYDFSDLKSKDMVEAFNNRKYTLTYSFPSTQTKQTITCSGDTAVITNEYYNLKYATLYKDNKSYILYKDRYCKNVETEKSIIEVTKCFEGLGFDSTGEIKLNDADCSYERLFNREKNSEFIIIFDETGAPAALKNDDIEMKIEFFSPNVDEELLEIPDSSTEIPETDMWTQLSTDLQL